MTILLCPDSFKECLPATDVCEALAEGIASACPEALIIRRPMADGGEGTIAAIQAGLGGELLPVCTTDCLGRTITADYLFQASSQTAVIESARACGLEQIAVEDRNVMTASTHGVGTLLMAAVAHGAKRVILTIGGTATVDGGTGLARALGYRFIDINGANIPEGGGALNQLAHIVPPDDTCAATVIVACDVDNPLLGDNGAATVFAPQKGASPSQVAILEHGLMRLAEVVESDLDRCMRDQPGYGAGGGISAGLCVFADAELASGVDIVMTSTGVQDAIAYADLVITGEGRTDGQTLNGKVCAGVARSCKAAGVPCVVISGDVLLDSCELRKMGVTSAVSISRGQATVADAIANAPALLRAAGADVARLFAAQRRSSCAD